MAKIWLQKSDGTRELVDTGEDSPEVFLQKRARAAGKDVSGNDLGGVARDQLLGALGPLAGAPNSIIQGARSVNDSVMGGIAAFNPLMHLAKILPSVEGPENKTKGLGALLDDATTGLKEDTAKMVRRNLSPEQARANEKEDLLDPRFYAGAISGSIGSMPATIAGGLLAGPIGASVTEGLQSTGMLEDGVSQNIAAFVLENPDKFVSSKLGAKYLQAAGGDYNKAVDIMTKDAMRKYGALNTAVVAGAGRIGSITPNILKKEAAEKIGQSMIKDILSEGVEEAIQSGAEQVTQNAIVGGVDKDTGLLDDVGKAALVGGITGAAASAPISGGAKWYSARARRARREAEGAGNAQEQIIPPTTASPFGTEPPVPGESGLGRTTTGFDQLVPPVGPAGPAPSPEVGTPPATGAAQPEEQTQELDPTMELYQMWAEAEGLTGEEKAAVDQEKDRLLGIISDKVAEKGATLEDVFNQNPKALISAFEQARDQVGLRKPPEVTDPDMELADNIRGELNRRGLSYQEEQARPSNAKRTYEPAPLYNYQLADQAEFIGANQDIIGDETKSVLDHVVRPNFFAEPYSPEEAEPDAYGLKVIDTLPDGTQKVHYVAADLGTIEEAQATAAKLNARQEPKKPEPTPQALETQAKAKKILPPQRLPEESLARGKPIARPAGKGKSLAAKDAERELAQEEDRSKIAHLTVAKRQAQKILDESGIDLNDPNAAPMLETNFEAANMRLKNQGWTPEQLGEFRTIYDQELAKRQAVRLPRGVALPVPQEQPAEKPYSAKARRAAISAAKALPDDVAAQARQSTAENPNQAWAQAKERLMETGLNETDIDRMEAGFKAEFKKSKEADRKAKEAEAKKAKEAADAIKKDAYKKSYSAQARRRKRAMANAGQLPVREAEPVAAPVPAPTPPKSIDDLMPDIPPRKPAAESAEPVSGREALAREPEQGAAEASAPPAEVRPDRDKTPFARLKARKISAAEFMVFVGRKGKTFKSYLEDVGVDKTHEAVDRILNKQGPAEAAPAEPKAPKVNKPYSYEIASDEVKKAADAEIKRITTKNANARRIAEVTGKATTEEKVPTQDEAALWARDTLKEKGKNVTLSKEETVKRMQEGKKAAEERKEAFVAEMANLPTVEQALEGAKVYAKEKGWTTKYTDTFLKKVTGAWEVAHGAEPAAPKSKIGAKEERELWAADLVMRSDSLEAALAAAAERNPDNVTKSRYDLAAVTRMWKAAHPEEAKPTKKKAEPKPAPEVDEDGEVIEPPKKHLTKDEKLFQQGLDEQFPKTRIQVSKFLNSEAALGTVNRSIDTLAANIVMLPEEYKAMLPELMALKKLIADYSADPKSVKQSDIQQKMSDITGLKLSADIDYSGFSEGKKKALAPDGPKMAVSGDRARLARAQAMGFDTSNVYYHGTTKDFTSFKASNNGALGPGVYLAISPDYAEYFGSKRRKPYTVIPVYIRGKLASASQLWNAEEEADVINSTAMDILKSKGYSGVRADYEIVVFDPADIRSTSASFLEEGDDLLAAVSGKPGDVSETTSPSYPADQRAGQEQSFAQAYVDKNWANATAGTDPNDVDYEQEVLNHYKDKLLSDMKRTPFLWSKSRMELVMAKVREEIARTGQTADRESTKLNSRAAEQYAIIEDIQRQVAQRKYGLKEGERQKLANAIGAEMEAVGLPTENIRVLLAETPAEIGAGMALAAGEDSTKALEYAQKAVEGDAMALSYVAKNDRKLITAVGVAQKFLDAKAPTSANLRRLQPVLTEEFVHIFKRLGMFKPKLWNKLVVAASTMRITEADTNYDGMEPFKVHEGSTPMEMANFQYGRLLKNKEAIQEEAVGKTLQIMTARRLARAEYDATLNPLMRQLVKFARALSRVFNRLSPSMKKRALQAAEDAERRLRTGKLAQDVGRAVKERAAEEADPKAMLINPRDKTLLATAMDMERRGVPMEEIWQRTFLFKSRDGTWMQWVSDADSRLTTEAMIEVSKASKDQPSEVIGSLYDILDHERLYEIFPDAKNLEVDVKIDPRLTKDIIYAEFDPNDNTIRGTVHDAANLHAVILHEVQHWVQLQEGLPFGHNQTDVVRQLQNRVGHLAKAEEVFKKLGNKDVVDTLKHARKVARKTIRYMTADPRKGDRINDLEHRIYRLAFGEVWARFTQNTAWLTEEMARNNWVGALVDEDLNQALNIGDIPEVVFNNKEMIEKIVRDVAEKNGFAVDDIDPATPIRHDPNRPKPLSAIRDNVRFSLENVLLDTLKAAEVGAEVPSHIKFITKNSNATPEDWLQYLRNKLRKLEAMEAVLDEMENQGITELGITIRPIDVDDIAGPHQRHYYGKIVRSDAGPKMAASSGKMLRTFDEKHPRSKKKVHAIQDKDGNVFITDGTTRSKVPTGEDPTTMTFVRALEILGDATLKANRRFGAAVAQVQNKILPTMTGYEDDIKRMKDEVKGIKYKTFKTPWGETVRIRDKTLNKAVVGGVFDSSDKDWEQYLIAKRDAVMDKIPGVKQFLQGLTPLGDLQHKSEYLWLRHLLQGKIARVEHMAEKMSERIADLENTEGGADKIALFKDYLTTIDPAEEAAALAKLSKEEVALAKEVKDAIEEVTNTLLEHKVLSKGQVEKYRRKYLRTAYATHIESYGKAIGIAASGAMYRFQKDDIPMSKQLSEGLIEYTPLLVYLSVAEPMVDVAKYTFFNSVMAHSMENNLNWVLPESMVKFGGQLMSRYALSQHYDRAINHMEGYRRELRTLDREKNPRRTDDLIRNIEVLRKLTNGMRAAIEQSAAYNLKENDKIPNGYVRLPDDQGKFADFAGAIVLKGLANDWTGGDQGRKNPDNWGYKIWDGYRDFVSFVKRNWTVRNPVAHTHNFLSNISWALPQSGTNSVRVVEAVQQLWEYYRTGTETPAITALRDAGLEIQTLGQAELRKLNRFADRVKVMEGRAERQRGIYDKIESVIPGAGQFLHNIETSFTMIKSAAGVLDNGATWTYQMGDTLFKLAKIIDELERGTPPIMAAQEASKYFFDYSLITSQIRTLRESGIVPFATFPYKRAIVSADIHTSAPWRMIPQYAMWAVLILASTAMMGNAPDEAKKALPEALRGRPLLFPFPIRDQYGRWQWIDLAAWTPDGSVVGLAAAISKGDLGDSLQALGATGGPAFAILAGVTTGVDPDNGMPIWNPEVDSNMIINAKRTAYSARKIMPSTLSYYLPALPGEQFGGTGYEALFGAGYDKRGLPTQTPAQLMSRMAGVAVYPSDIPVGVQKQMELYKRVFLPQAEAELNRRLKDLRNFKLGPDGRPVRGPDGRPIMTDQGRKNIQAAQDRIQALQRERNEYYNAALDKLVKDELLYKEETGKVIE